MKHLVGSRYFFSKYPDYVIKDTDYVTLEDNPKLYKTMMLLRGQGIDHSFWRKMPFDEFLKQTEDPIQIGKFLVPEVAEELNLTIDDLKQLIPLSEQLDDKHKYIKTILNSYIQNNEFKLTDKQLDEAYTIYKKYRK